MTLTPEKKTELLGAASLLHRAADDDGITCRVDDAYRCLRDFIHGIPCSDSPTSRPLTTFLPPQANEPSTNEELETELLFSEQGLEPPLATERITEAFKEQAVLVIFGETRRLYPLKITPQGEPNILQLPVGEAPFLLRNLTVVEPITNENHEPEVRLRRVTGVLRSGKYPIVAIDTARD